MTNLETWVSLASLALIVMFVILLNSFVTVLIGPQSQGPNVDVQPPGVMIQIVSISGAPGVILGGITYGLAKNYGSRNSGIILTLTGAILVGGLLYIGSRAPNIPENYTVPYFEPLRYAFIAAGLGIIAVGAILIKNPRKSRTNLADENNW
jgi:hypothetical protein